MKRTLKPEVVAQFSDIEDNFGYVADWSVSDASDCKCSIRAPVACDTAPLPQKPVNDTWEWRGPCCLIRIHRQPKKTSLAQLGKSLSGTIERFILSERQFSNPWVQNLSNQIWRK